jgi:hypothetical protein
VLVIEIVIEKRTTIDHEQEQEHDYEGEAAERAIHPACFSQSG